MSPLLKPSSAEQTLAKRAVLLARLEQATPRLLPMGSLEQLLRQRYLAGQLSWLELCLALP